MHWYEQELRAHENLVVGVRKDSETNQGFVLDQNDRDAIIELRAKHYIGKIDQFRNDFLPDFRLQHNVQYRRAGELRVHDPRGFSVEIDSDNLDYLLRHCKIENGFIRTPCFWTSYRKDPILIPKNSRAALCAVEREYLYTHSVGLRQLDRGNVVRMRDGSQAVYLGLWRIMGHYNGWRSNNSTRISFWNIEKQYLILKKDPVTAEPVLETFSSSPNVAEILDTSTSFDLEEAQEFLYSQMRGSLTLANYRGGFNILYAAPVKFGRNDFEIRLTTPVQTSTLNTGDFPAMYVKIGSAEYVKSPYSGSWYTSTDPLFDAQGNLTGNQMELFKATHPITTPNEVQLIEIWNAKKPKLSKVLRFPLTT